MTAPAERHGRIRLRAVVEDQGSTGTARRASVLRVPGRAAGCAPRPRCKVILSTGQRRRCAGRSLQAHAASSPRSRWMCRHLRPPLLPRYGRLPYRSAVGLPNCAGVPACVLSIACSGSLPSPCTPVPTRPDFAPLWLPCGSQALVRLRNQHRVRRRQRPVNCCNTTGVRFGRKFLQNNELVFATLRQRGNTTRRTVFARCISASSAAPTIRPATSSAATGGTACSA